MARPRFAALATSGPAPGSIPTARTTTTTAAATSVPTVEATMIRRGMDRPLPGGSGDRNAGRRPGAGGEVRAGRGDVGGGGDPYLERLGGGRDRVREAGLGARAGPSQGLHAGRRVHAPPRGTCPAGRAQRKRVAGGIGRSRRCHGLVPGPFAVGAGQQVLEGRSEPAPRTVQATPRGHRQAAHDHRDLRRCEPLPLRQQQDLAITRPQATKRLVHERLLRLVRGRFLHL
jgi:hypothetical protein